MQGISPEAIIYTSIALTVLAGLLTVFFPVVVSTIAGIAMLLIALFTLNTTKTPTSDVTAAILIVGGFVLATMAGGIHRISRPKTSDDIKNSSDVRSPPRL